jgi:hypothetical protein
MPRRVPWSHGAWRRPSRPNAAKRGYTDRRHREFRLAVLRRDNWQCRSCGRLCTDKREAHADHVSPVVQGTDYCESGCSRYDVGNGQCLCDSCHSKKTAFESSGDARIVADPGGASQSSQPPAQVNHSLAARGRPQVLEGGGLPAPPGAQLPPEGQPVAQAMSHSGPTVGLGCEGVVHG